MTGKAAQKVRHRQAVRGDRKATSRKSAAATIETLETWKSVACMLAVLLLLCVTVWYTIPATSTPGTLLCIAPVHGCQARFLDNKRAEESMDKLQQPSDKQDSANSYDQV